MQFKSVKNFEFLAFEKKATLTIGLLFLLNKKKKTNKNKKARFVSLLIHAQQLEEVRRSASSIFKVQLGRSTIESSTNEVF